MLAHTRIIEHVYMRNNYSIIYVHNSVAFGKLKQQNRYLSVIIVCGYFSFIRRFTCLNFPSKSHSYHNTSLSMSFGCWHLSGIPLCPLHFTVYNSVAEEIRTAVSILHQFMHFKWLKGEMPATFITCILRNSHDI